MTIHSCIYVGQVRHRRHKPRPHTFDYRLFLMYLDLDELPSLFNKRWLWSISRPNLAWFRRKDHLGEPQVPLSDAVRDLIEERTGKRPQGPIRLLTHLRYFGHYFNPVSFYYCFDRSDSSVETIVAEVNNTPWGEQYCYVLDESINQGQGSNKRYQLNKKFHVSPFMDMDISYDWRFLTPSDRLAVHMENSKNDDKIFDATLKLERRELNSFAMARVLFTYPLVTVKVVTAIYFEALRLWLKRTPFYDHPKEAPKSVKSL